MHASSLQDSSVLNQDTAHNLIGEQLDAHSQRFTDGGFNEDVAAYCFYARKNYKKGEQVLQICFELVYIYKLLFYC